MRVLQYLAARRRQGTPDNVDAKCDLAVCVDTVECRNAVEQCGAPARHNPTALSRRQHLERTLRVLCFYLTCLFAVSADLQNAHSATHRCQPFEKNGAVFIIHGYVCQSRTQLCGLGADFGREPAWHNMQHVFADLCTRHPTQIVAGDH